VLTSPCSLAFGEDNESFVVLRSDREDHVVRRSCFLENDNAIADTLGR
jgi:hypothetical protein